MPSARRHFLPLLLIALFVRGAAAQENISGSVAIRLALARLNTLGSVLMIGAHPDDEHSDTVAYFSRGRSMRTAYLSLTRGEGGQNLIGSEQGDLLGVIRTQELLAARRVDGAGQFFTRAIDFGFSKSPEETLEKWGREKILSDIVWVIRSFRPDVVILCFSGTPRDGHGQHQASAVLGKEAFFAAADKTRFPEQLKLAEPWQAKRLVWNVYGESDAPGQVAIDTGRYDPLLGYSYAEIAAMSRSMHRSQAMGVGARHGSVMSAFVPVAGEPATKDLFDGIDTTWNRVPGGGPAGERLGQALRNFDDLHPERALPALLDARKAIAALRDPWAVRKLSELDETIALCAGLWLDASADRYEAVPGSTATVHATALDRAGVPARLLSVSLDPAAGEARMDEDLAANRPSTRDFTWKVPADRPVSQPYWLVEPKQGDAYTVSDQSLIGMAENPPELRARFRLRLGPEEIGIERPVRYRYIDPSRGELRRPLVIVPPVALGFDRPVYVLPDRSPRKLEVMIRSEVAGAGGEVHVAAPAGWRAEPASQNFALSDADSQSSAGFEVIPPGTESRAWARAGALMKGAEISAGMREISYPHFPPQVVFPPPASLVVRADIRVLAKRIGYIMGAGDEIPAALEQLGCEVHLLNAADLATGDLSRFDAIVTGVRAYNVRRDLWANQHRLLDYARNGGTLVVQYNVVDRSTSAEALEKIGPYPIHISHDRVTVEAAPVSFTDPASPLLHSPNAISSSDFQGWIQERGLYFPDRWDPRYKTALESHDPGEPPLAGGTLYTRYGKGVYVFTAYSWFRELPAGVPGAFRVFANLLSAGKVLE